MVVGRLAVPAAILSAVGIWSAIEIIRYGQDEPAIFLHDSDLDLEEDDYNNYLEFFQKRGVTVVDEKTSTETLGNILLGRMFPHYRSNYTFKPGQMFDGSPQMTLEGERRTKNGKSTFVFKKSGEDDLKKLREACIAALKLPKDKEKKEDPQLYKLREWCATSTVKDVLRRHKFTFPQRDEDWKTIASSGWFTEESNHTKQGFFSTEEMKKVKDNQSQEGWKTIKTKCEEALKKPFGRTNFPATTDFLGAGQKADEFQEAAMFCTTPMTAGDYVERAMQGKLRDQIPQHLRNEYCYVDKKSADEYKNVKTTDPMEGKSFWCAVGMMYERYNPKSIRAR